MLRRLALRDVAIVPELALEFEAGFTVLTGETGAGKSILIDALQLALGARADATLVREGASRAEVSAEFDSPPALAGWLEEAGFRDDSDDRLLLRRSVDAQGRSRAWINGSAATMAQLREAADALLDIHGQHAWQSLTRPPAVRDMLDSQAGVDTAPLAAAWRQWRACEAALSTARSQRDSLSRERDRLVWQIGELQALAPADGEWEALNAEHERLAHGQALIDAARSALEALADGEPSAGGLMARAVDSLDEVQRHDTVLAPLVDELRSAQAQLEDASHSLTRYLARAEPNPTRLAELDTRLSSWLSLARRFRRTPAELPALLAGWQGELASLDAAADLDALQRRSDEAEAAWRAEAKRISKLRRKAAPQLSSAVTAAMQPLGMEGGRFEVVLQPQDSPQAFGLESAELLVAGHAGSAPRPLAKVASGGELSRLALAIAVTAAERAQAAASGPGTLIFDEIDAGVGGRVADTVGRLMKRLGAHTQVLAVTHLAQVAACADQHFVVSKTLQGGQTVSTVQPVRDEARVAEVARMLGGERLASDTSRAHALAMLGESRAP
ncbi:MAG: DNA repair protein RecN [Rubrivivax sp.]|nr:DNA repair protein RecN [Rubrivivax sp.]MDH5339944.1 DNA repair protein RecN [Rubrivivax sp.]